MGCDFLLEKKLKKDNPELHGIFTDTVSIMCVMLEKYKGIFPYFTDHSMRHAINVIEFANKIIGEDDIEKMNVEEIFIFLLGAYFHDVGMGVSEKDFLAFIPNIDNTVTFDFDDKIELHNLMRKYHHELSSEFVKKYAHIFDITDEKYIFALAQITRGHRVTDLFNENDFPINYILDSGNTVCLPYLGALIRLADEIDISSDRNEEDMYTIKESYSELTIKCFSIHYAITSVEVTEDAFVLMIDTKDEEVFEDIKDEIQIIQQKLDVCRNAVNERTKYKISQKEIRYCRI